MNAVSVMGGAINSASLTDYQLTKAHQSLLTKFDKLCRYMELANKKAPCLRLSRVDYTEINQRVAQQSEGARIAELLAGKSLTIPEMAQLLGVNPMGIQSCANAMVRRGELVRLRRALGQPFAYRLPEKKRAAA